MVLYSNQVKQALLQIPMESSSMLKASKRRDLIGAEKAMEIRAQANPSMLWQGSHKLKT